VPKSQFLMKGPEKPRARTRSPAFILLLLGVLGLGLSLSACSRHSLPEDEFKILQNPSQDQAAAALEAAKSDCEAQTRHHGIASILSIFTHLRPGAARRDYIACMKAKGYSPDGDQPDADAPPPS
jgi:hypothetical protein